MSNWKCVNAYIFLLKSLISPDSYSEPYSHKENYSIGSMWGFDFNHEVPQLFPGALISHSFPDFVCLQ